MPKLRTLHYIACEQPSISRGVYHLRYFTLDNLRELTISGAAPGHRCKPETILLAYMRPSGKTTFERLILKNIGMHADISWTLSETIIALVERCYIKTLIFDNVQYTLSDKITLSGPSDPKVISEKFKPFNVIAATARNVKIIQSSGMETWYKTDGLIHSASEAS